MAFLDAWVVDKTLFDYVSQGGCACCGISHTMVNLDKFQQCSDWDTDDEQRELFSPWPTFIHEDVQTQRCLIRSSMKPQMQKYNAFLNEHGKEFERWFLELSKAAKCRIFQVPDVETLQYLSTHGDIHGPYGIVLQAVTDQIKQFDQTGYVDARCDPELDFEQSLKYEKGVFTLRPEYYESSKLMACLKYLGGPRLFPSCTDNNSFKSNQTEAEQIVQSFRSDRRLIRLVVLRLFIDMLIRKYHQENKSNN